LGKGGKLLRGATQEQKRLVECTSEEAAGKLGAEIPFGKVFRRTRRRVVVSGVVPECFPSLLGRRGTWAKPGPMEERGNAGNPHNTITHCWESYSQEECH